MVTRVCEYCGNEFQPKIMGPKNPRFCSPKCQNDNWREKNPDRIRQLWRNSYYRNAESKKARSAKYRRENPDINRASVRRYSKTERGQLSNRLRVKRYRARKLGAEGSHTHEQFLDLIRTFNSTCPGCGSVFPIGKFTKDHVIPLSMGGSDWIENIQPLCHSCNSRKKDQTIDYRVAINF